jgi:hypothetical protein
MNARTALLLLAASLPLPAFASSPQPPGSTPTNGDTAQAAPSERDPAPAVAGEGTSQAPEASGIVLGPELDGRFFVYNADGSLVTELYKPAGRTVELGLGPGTYDVVYEREPLRLDTSVTLGERQRKLLDRASFREVERVPAPQHDHHHAEQAPEKPQGLFMNGRTRVEFFGGFTDSYVEVENGHDDSHVEVGGGQGGMAFAHWVREDLALDFQFLATDVDVTEIDYGPRESTETRGATGLLFGARYYFPKATFGGSFRPYVAGAIGPFSEYYVFDSEHHTEVHHNNTTFGGQLGAGVDFQLSRLFSLGVKMAVNLRDDHDPSFGATFGFGFAWGKGRTTR